MVLLCFFRGPLLWILAFGALVLIVMYGINPGGSYEKADTSRVGQAIQNNEVTSAQIIDKDQRIEVKLKNGKQLQAQWVDGQGLDLARQLQTKAAAGQLKSYTVTVPKQHVFLSLLFSFLPIVVVVLIFLFIMNQMQGGGSRVMNFGKSKAKLVTKDTPKTTCADVAGADEAIEELQEIKEFLQHPAKFQAIGAKIPKGVLLYGSPGTGKTLLARAVAGEAGVPFYSLSGSDFVEMFVGVGASRVRDLFEQAKASAPCIVFIDELDAIGRQRGVHVGAVNDEREQTLNQLLVEMDGFEANKGVILLAATNRPEVLDRALLRPGRFDRQVVVAAPDLRGREGILRVHMRKVP